VIPAFKGCELSVWGCELSTGTSHYSHNWPVRALENARLHQDWQILC